MSMLVLRRSNNHYRLQHVRAQSRRRLCRCQKLPRQRQGVVVSLVSLISKCSSSVGYRQADDSSGGRPLPQPVVSRYRDVSTGNIPDSAPCNKKLTQAAVRQQFVEVRVNLHLRRPVTPCDSEEVYVLPREGQVEECRWHQRRGCASVSRHQYMSTSRTPPGPAWTQGRGLYVMLNVMCIGRAQQQEARKGLDQKAGSS
jgi:hypothetical protein